MYGKNSLAVHEAAHVCAAFFCDRDRLDCDRPRPIEGVSIRWQGKGDAGRAIVGTRNEPTLDQALDDIAIHLVGDLAAEMYPNDPVLDPACDETVAIDIAMKVTKSHYETRAIVELGRARARTLIHRPDFQRALHALWPRLLREEELDGETCRAICTEALED